MNKRRLLKLADLLEADAKNRRGIQFHFSEWGTVRKPKKPLSCGTTACAMGLAALSGAFKRQGLRYSIDQSYSEIDICFRVKDGTMLYGGINAAMELFDISEDHATWLFTSHNGLSDTTGADGERAVASRIREYARTGETG